MNVRMAANVSASLSAMSMLPLLSLCELIFYKASPEIDPFGANYPPSGLLVVGRSDSFGK